MSGGGCGASRPTRAALGSSGAHEMPGTEKDAAGGRPFKLFPPELEFVQVRPVAPQGLRSPDTAALGRQKGKNAGAKAP